jgi:hypothetical protein
LRVVFSPKKKITEDPVCPDSVSSSESTGVFLGDVHQNLNHHLADERRQEPMVSGNDDLSLASIKDIEEEIVVWWYGGIVNNPQAMTVPKVIVFFRGISGKGQMGDILSRSVGITHLGRLRMGSTWKSGRYSGEADLPWEQMDVDLDFTESPDLCVSPFEYHREHQEILIPQKDYPLKYSFDKNYLLRFPFGKGQTLLIPCLEFFTRCYGRSAELRRILATYPWQECEKRLFSQLEEPDPPGKWAVTIAERMQLRDAAFLAHLRHDSYAQKRARSIYAQIATQITGSQGIAFLKVLPWFRGSATLRVRGLWIDSQRTFLALRILGASDPAGPSLICRKPETEGSPGEKDSRKDEEKILFQKKSPLTLTEDVEPDRVSGVASVQEEPFVVLGTPRKIVVEKSKASSKKFSGIPGGPGTVSTGEKYGSGKETGQADVHSPAEFPSEGVLFDLWRAFLHFRETGVVREVAWYSPSRGFCSEGYPSLVSLWNSQKGDFLPNKWIFVDPEKRRIRGVLVLRVRTAAECLYVLEIERRRISGEDFPGGGFEEESLRGMIIRRVSEETFLNWLPGFLPRIVEVRGVLKKLLGHSPGSARVFKHTTAKSDRIPLEGAVRHLIGGV